MATGACAACVGDNHLVPDESESAGQTPRSLDRGVVSYPLQASEDGKPRIVPATHYARLRTPPHDKRGGGCVGSRLQRCTAFPLFPFLAIARNISIGD